MIVIIPHPTEELKLIKLQKQLISALNKNGTVYYSSTPLCIDLQACSPELPVKPQLKTAADSITDISFLRLIADKDISIEVTINTKEGTLQKTLPFLKHYKGPVVLQADIDAFILPFKELRIFRIAKKNLPSPVSSAIADSVWKKLH